MADLFQEGINLFNCGEYFAAHEAWEDLWRETTGSLRLYYQGLIQAAVGLHHFTNGNLDGASAQLTKSVMKIEQYPSIFCTVNNARLISDLRRVLQERSADMVVIEQV